MTHIEQRLAERNISIDKAKLDLIAKSCGNTSAAVLLGRVSNQNSGEYFVSNGELVVLIVRHGEAKTIMFRRENQPFTCEALRVDKVYSI